VGDIELEPQAVRVHGADSVEEPMASEAAQATRANPRGDEVAQPRASGFARGPLQRGASAMSVQSGQVFKLSDALAKEMAMFDKNSDGSIDSEELLHLLQLAKKKVASSLKYRRMLYVLLAVTFVIVLASFGLSFAAMKLAQNTDVRQEGGAVGVPVLTTHEGKHVTVQANNLDYSFDSMDVKTAAEAGAANTAQARHITSLLGVEMLHDRSATSRARILAAVDDAIRAPDGFQVLGTVASSAVSASEAASNINAVSIVATVTTAFGVTVLPLRLQEKRVTDVTDVWRGYIEDDPQSIIYWIACTKPRTATCTVFSPILADPRPTRRRRQRSRPLRPPTHSARWPCRSAAVSPRVSDLAGRHTCAAGRTSQRSSQSSTAATRTTPA